MQKYPLRVPGIGETKTTLAQPTALRLIPWLILIEAVIGLFTSNLQRAAVSLISYPISWLELAVILLPSIISLAIAYFLASRIKHGDLVFVWFLRITAFLAIIISLVQSYFFITNFQLSFLEINSYTLSFHAQQMLTILVNAYILYVLFKYEKELREGGESFKKEPSYNERKEKLAHRAGIAAIIVIPLLYSIGLSLWISQRTTQRFIEENNIPTYEYPE
ncbi:MAG: hypothetical protein K0S20_703 [Patescibacteria group bacterium]|nr:hypothetical protein [Patescibacteria group bacterium]